MHRRDLLTLIAASAVISLTGCSADAPGAPSASSEAVGRVLPLVPLARKFPAPFAAIYGLPDVGDRMAWTVDDGASSEVVAAYAQFARDSGARVTFFLNGRRPSWTENRAALQPLVDSGQVQLGNHTFSHRDLTKLSDAGIADELQRNDAFIQDNYGVSAAPFFRPPYGQIDKRVAGVATSIGYHTPVMWLGTLSDSSPLAPSQLLGFAEKWFGPKRIVLGHANFPAVTGVYAQLVDILNARKLQLVTLNDVYSH